MSVSLRPDFPLAAGCSSGGPTPAGADPVGRTTTSPAGAPDLEWRGKSVRALTPDEVAVFADWAYREHARLREERDRYLGRAVRAEAAIRRRETHIGQLIDERENDCGNDPTYDTREERDMDLGVEGRRRRCWEE